MTQRRAKYLKDKLYELYTLLYNAATPSVDFRELVAMSPWIKRNKLPSEYWKMTKEEQSKFIKTFEFETLYPAECISEEKAINEGMQRKIDWDSYYLDKDVYAKIVDDFINDKKNKFTTIEKKKFRTEAYLGCGPTTASRKEKE